MATDDRVTEQQEERDGDEDVQDASASNPKTAVKSLAGKRLKMFLWGSTATLIGALWAVPALQFLWLQSLVSSKPFVRFEFYEHALMLVITLAEILIIMLLATITVCIVNFYEIGLFSQIGVYARIFTGDAEAAISKACGL